MTREGPFWEAGTIEVAFTAREQFLNPVGAIQGGFLAAAYQRPRCTTSPNGRRSGWRIGVSASQVCMLPSFTSRARTAARAARPTSFARTLRPVRRPRRAGHRDGRVPPG